MDKLLDNSPSSPDKENKRDRAGQGRDEEVLLSLYGKSEKIYPREVHGAFAQFRVLAAVGLLGIFYGLPWLQWNGNQSVLLDLPARKFYIFGLVFWPQDLLYLTFLLVIAALSLFFFTALAGRLWCGYACPQTVWTESFLWLEYMIEGSRVRQIQLDRAPLTFRKFRIKATKHLVWLLFSAFTGFTFVSYFTPAKELLVELMQFRLGPWEAFWMFFYGLATYGNAGWLREQVCKYMCPYARFQSAMFDNDTLIISYDEKRGEPRGARKPSIDHRRAGLGDCINCKMCVQACPTGIDIRDGLQYECIGCSACIDVCNDVMDKMGYPQGLIRYTTQNALIGATSRIIRPRIIIYGLILVSLFGIFLYLLSQRLPVGLDIIRDRNQLYRETSGMIENVYTLKILNMDERPHDYNLRAEGLPDLVLALDQTPVEVDAGKVIDLPVRLRVPEDNIYASSMDVIFTLSATDNDKIAISKKARFLGPRP